MNHKIEIILKYRPELKTLYDRVYSELPENYLQLLETHIEADPKISEAQLEQLIYSAYEIDNSPFDDEKANGIYQSLMRKNESEAEEFKEAYNMLGDSLDLNQFEISSSALRGESLISTSHIESFSANDSTPPLEEPNDLLTKADLYSIYSVTNTTDLMKKLGVDYSASKGYAVNEQWYSDLDQALYEAHHIKSQSAEPDRSDEVDQGPTGLGGWLIIVGIGIILSPLRLLGEAAKYYKELGMDSFRWKVITNPASEYYIYGLDTFVKIEMLANGIILLATISLIYFFFAKKAIFPKLYIWIAVGSIAIVILDLILAANLFDTKIETADFVDVFKAIVVGLIWIPYMLQSKRVKNTFIR